MSAFEYVARSLLWGTWIGVCTVIGPSIIEYIFNKKKRKKKRKKKKKTNK